MTPVSIDAALERLVRRLLDERNPRGHWTGELSSSALSTATAVIALNISGRRPDLVAGGLRWLETRVNPDGGWGDTVRSISNISTTALCWSAFSIASPDSPAAHGAAGWLRRAAGSLEPAALARAIAVRYGDDHTFSVPILTVLALAARVPWDMVPQLPFELAALPAGTFRWLRLPVVSYALPALIAIGQVRHRRLASTNAPLRALRDRLSDRTLQTLDRIQPPNGGFLEATPLTSFVAMSLFAAGYYDHPVLERALGFLERAVSADGSWPIDTNLATWVTTLSVNALRHRLPQADREPVRRWLLEQQYRVVHPYTEAPPGGWAWTDLPGGVPDADDTAGAMLALHHLGDGGGEARDAAARGAVWLMGLQNRDGGVPTFCRGWGKLPFDRSSPDITAHAVRAWWTWKDRFDAPLRDQCQRAIARALVFLRRSQRADGACVPLWFGNQFGHNDENPVYGTSRVLQALRGIDSAMAQRAGEWLLSVQNPDGGWGGDRGIASTIEETAWALEGLCGAEVKEAREARARASQWLVEAVGAEQELHAAPVGFYFARLWYYERLYPLIFAAAALSAMADGEG